MPTFLVQINAPCLENAYVPCTNHRALSGEYLRSLYKSTRRVWRMPTFLVQINAPCLENAYVPCTNQRAMSGECLRSLCKSTCVSGECLRSLCKSTRHVWRMPTFLVQISSSSFTRQYDLKLVCELFRFISVLAKMFHII